MLFSKAKMKIEDELHVSLRNMELNNATVVVVSLAVSALLVMALAVLAYAHINALKQITELSNHRYMYGFEQKKGVFVSVTERPKYMLERYARDVINNQYNYDRNTIDENFKYILSLYDPRVNLQTVQADLDKLKKNTYENAFSQNARVSRKYTIKEDKLTYTLTFKVQITQYVTNIPADKYETKVKVIMAKIAPTKARRLGISLWSLGEPKGARVSDK